MDERKLSFKIPIFIPKELKVDFRKMIDEMKAYAYQYTIHIVEDDFSHMNYTKSHDYRIFLTTEENPTLIIGG